MSDPLRPEAFAEDDAAAQILPVWAGFLGLIVRLHEREADADLLAGLRDADLGELMESLLPGADGQEVASAFVQMLGDVPEVPDEIFLDNLAADFADIYLTHGFRVAPSGSVWLTDDHLERQQPMFDVREWYDHYGLSVPNWRLRSDDNIVHELQFVQYLLGLGTLSAAGDAARFLDRHVLPWVPDFCTRAAQHAREPFHGLACLLTRAALGELRDALEAITGLAREKIDHAWVIEADRARRAAEVPDIERPFMPGLAESW